MPKFTKNGKTRKTDSPREAVRLRFDGWRQVSDKPALDVPETTTEPETPKTPKK